MKRNNNRLSFSNTNKTLLQNYCIQRKCFIINVIVLNNNLIKVFFLVPYLIHNYSSKKAIIEIVPELSMEQMYYMAKGFWTHGYHTLSTSQY